MHNTSPLSLTLGEILALYAAICGAPSGVHLGLNGYQKAVGQNIMVQPYSFTDETRLHIAAVRFKLKGFAEELDRGERVRITALVMGDAGAQFVPQGDEAKQALWANLYAKVLAIRIEVTGLHVFQRGDFFRDNKNPIPPEVEIGLGPIIEGSPWREAFIPKAPAAAAIPPAPPGGETDDA